MAFGGLDKKPSGTPMADINMTPLIDVILVLLVIFIITAPLFTHAIRLDLPKVASQPARETPQTVTLSIDDAGKLYWNDQPVSFDQMRTRFADAGKAAEKPELPARIERDALRRHRQGDGRGTAGGTGAHRLRHAAGGGAVALTVDSA